ncbi:hypothetical protein LZ32DRAFT_688553 [Colletotrichum eremochloae]|nr:hypothetical protein LZ32DRAFT_688553 [Colletotrichum eremochloae]
MSQSFSNTPYGARAVSTSEQGRGPGRAGFDPSGSMSRGGARTFRFIDDERNTGGFDYSSSDEIFAEFMRAVHDGEIPIKPRLRNPIAKAQQPEGDPEAKWNAFSSKISPTISRDNTACKEDRQRHLLAGWSRQGQFRDTETREAMPPNTFVDSTEVREHKKTLMNSAKYMQSRKPRHPSIRTATMFNDTLDEGVYSRPYSGPERAETSSHRISETTLLRDPGLSPKTRVPSLPSKSSEYEASDSEVSDYVTSELGDFDPEDSVSANGHFYRSSGPNPHSPETIPAEYGQRTRYIGFNGGTVAIPDRLPYEPYGRIYRNESPPLGKREVYLPNPSKEIAS